ncbi:MAG TPA: YceI family protein [Candidatus Limnocylindrales bacterium]|nr:YceI family protein [Candidatus Limnocylindrales bacterium]
MRIEGTSNLDDWQVESRSVGGYLETDENFPGNLGRTNSATDISARVECAVAVRSLKSVEKDGKPFSNLMDEIMYGKLKAGESPNIQYRLRKLRLKGVPKTGEQTYRLECSGELMLAGVTNQVSFPITLERLGSQQLRISGSTALRMTDFQIEPPAPKIALGTVKTGDEVKLSFEWVLAPAKGAHSEKAAGALPR